MMREVNGFPILEKHHYQGEDAVLSQFVRRNKTENKAIGMVEQQKAHLAQLILFSKCSRELSTLNSILHQVAAAESSRGHGRTKEGACLHVGFPGLLAWSWLVHEQRKARRPWNGGPVYFPLWYISYLHTQKRGTKSWNFFFSPPPRRKLQEERIIMEIFYFSLKNKTLYQITF